MVLRFKFNLAGTEISHSVLHQFLHYAVFSQPRRLLLAQQGSFCNAVINLHARSALGSTSQVASCSHK